MNIFYQSNDQSMKLIKLVIELSWAQTCNLENPSNDRKPLLKMHLYAYIHVHEYTNAYCTYIYSVKTLTVAG